MMYWNGGMGWWVVFGGLAFWGAIIALIVWLVIRLTRTATAKHRIHLNRGARWTLPGSVTPGVRSPRRNSMRSNEISADRGE
jgi:hypothetical protein